ncbi:MAG: 1-phosphofructokinase [Fimbriimonadaceae bacterium]|jgi:1-phosphofructokinase family hexose kinase|nr:1-phosphofructokinase [Fimbriimonadaceae bacterium]
MILSITLNPCVDHTLFVQGLHVGDTNRVQRTETDAGGKGVNLSRIVAELGGDTLATGFLGGGSGAYVTHVLDAQKVRHDFVRISGTTRTNLSVESGEGPPTTLNERGPEISPQEWETLLHHVAHLAKEAKWVALGGSLPPGVPTEAFAILGDIAKQAGCRLVLDADGEPQKLGLKAGPDMVKPNVKEAERWLGHPLATETDIVAGAKELEELLLDQGAKDPWVVISRGKDGAVLSHRGETYSAESIPVAVKSTIGSGDSLIGGMLYGIQSGVSTLEAFAFGLAAGAATAMSDGSGIGRREDILTLKPQAKISRI